MLVIRRGRLTTEKWFADRLSPLDALGIVTYRQFPDTRPKPFFFRKPYSTIFVDLAQDPDSLFQGFARQTRSQINKARGLGIEAKQASMQELVPFLNEFARAKQIRTIRRESLLKMQADVIVTAARLGGETLVMHCHLLDPQISRAMCLFSASKRLTDGGNDKHKIIGYANRYLHWQDMVLFKEKGYRTYDFGGYCRTEDDHVKQQINQFKTGFTKNIADEYTYLSPLALLARLLRSR